MIILNKNLNFYTNKTFENLIGSTMNFLILKVFVGKLTKNGKKLAALKFVYAILLNLRVNFYNKNKEIYIDKDTLLVSVYDGALSFFSCIKLILPIIRLVRKKVAGSIYDLPTPLFKPKQAITKAFKSIIVNSYKRNDKSFSLKILSEIYSTLKRKSNSYLKKKSDYKIAFRGIPFLHFLKSKHPKAKYNDYKSLQFNYTKSRNSFNIPNFEQKRILNFTSKGKLNRTRVLKKSILLFKWEKTLEYRKNFQIYLNKFKKKKHNLFKFNKTTKKKQ